MVCFDFSIPARAPVALLIAGLIIKLKHSLIVATDIKECFNMAMLC